MRVHGEFLEELRKSLLLGEVRVCPALLAPLLAVDRLGTCCRSPCA
jgi:hypothetical protein